MNENNRFTPMQMVSVHDHQRNEIFTGIVTGEVNGNNVQVVLLTDGNCHVAPSWVLSGNIVPVEDKDLERLSKFHATSIAYITKMIEKFQNKSIVFSQDKLIDDQPAEIIQKGDKLWMVELETGNSRSEWCSKAVSSRNPPKRFRRLRLNAVGIPLL